MLTPHTRLKALYVSVSHNQNKLKNMLFLFKFFSFVFFFFGPLCGSFFFKSNIPLLRTGKDAKLVLQSRCPPFPLLQVFLVFPSFGCHRTFCSAFLFLPLSFCQFFPIFFFRQKPDAFYPENHGAVDDLCNTQKESHQQKHCTCLFTDACTWLFFSGKMPDSNTPPALIT